MHPSILSLQWENQWTPIDCHCKNFNSLILSSHTWNIVKKCPSQIYKHSKSDLDTFLTMFHVWELRIKLLKFLQWQSMGVHDFPIVKIGLMGAINHCFNNKSQTDPSPCSRSNFSLSGQRQSNSQCKQSVVLSYDMDAMVMPYSPLWQ